MGHKIINLGHKIFKAVEGAPTDGFLGNDVKPDLHLIQPGGVGGCVMHMVASTNRSGVRVLARLSSIASFIYICTNRVEGNFHGFSGGVGFNRGDRHKWS
jgi:hypothetical protein